jgi:hypothetical protein
MSDVTFDMASNQMEVHQPKAEPWSARAAIRAQQIQKYVAAMQV